MNSDFWDALGGRQVGTIESLNSGWRWACQCDETGDCSSEQKAALALYRHRQEKHVREKI